LSRRRGWRAEEEYEVKIMKDERIAQKGQRGMGAEGGGRRALLTLYKKTI